MGKPNKQELQPWKFFPTINTAAYYSTFGNYIKLNRISQRKFMEISADLLRYRNEFSIFLHEYQHWIDHTSTFWGQENFSKIFLAFESCFLGTEHDFYRRRDIHRSIRRDRLLEYYTEIYAEIQGSTVEKWRYDFSSGLRFDHTGAINESDPLVFVRFKSIDDQDIARVPLSVSSLLETTAMSREITFRLEAILEKFADDDEQRVRELKLLESSTVRQLYNPNFTLYSVAVHTACNKLKISDIINGYRISSQFATLALNLPPSVFTKIQIPDEIVAGWGQRGNDLLAIKDRGFAYLCLVWNYSIHFADSESVYPLELDNILRASDLPDSKSLDLTIESELHEIGVETSINLKVLLNTYFDRLRAGKWYRNYFGIANEKNLEFTIFNESSPYIVFSDTKVDLDSDQLGQVTQKLLGGEVLNLKEWWEVYEYCDWKLDEFNEVCGI